MTPAMTNTPETGTATFAQHEFTIERKRRGFHLITREVLSQLPEIASVRIGVLHLFIKHTSASLTINENADPTVRSDMERYFTELAPEGGASYEHDTEGDDDMPAHIKSSILGSSVTIPLTDGTSISEPGKESTSANIGTTAEGVNSWRQSGANIAEPTVYCPLFPVPCLLSPALLSTSLNPFP